MILWTIKVVNTQFSKMKKYLKEMILNENCILKQWSSNKN